MADLELLKTRKPKDRNRFTVDLPCVLDSRLEAIAAKHNMTKTDVIRDAVRLLAEYDRLKTEGYETGGWKSGADGSRDTVRISIGL